MTVEQIKSQLAQLTTECESLVAKQNFSKADKSSVDLKLSQIADLRSQLKRMSITDAERRQKMHDLVTKIGPEALQSNEEKGSIRHQLINNEALRTYSAMSEGTSTSGGDFIKTGFFYKLSQALKQADALFDDSVTLPLLTDKGAPLSAPFVSDVGTSATVVSENAQSSEAEITTISRLSFSKTPTYRTGQMVASLELLQDSAFPIEDSVLVPLAMKRLQRGVGQAGVTALLAGSSSGASSAAAGTCKVDDVLATIASVDPAYLSGPRSFIGMNFGTLTSLMRQTTTTGALVWRPRHDSNGRPMLGNLPVIICPSLADVATSAKPVVVGDFGALIHRQTKSVDVRRYSQNIALIERGMVAFEVFARHDWGVIDGNALKYLTIS